MTFTQEQIQDIESLAGLNYTVKQIAVYLDVDPADLYHEFNEKESEFRRYYDRGRLITQAKIDKQASEAATGGNITAMQQYEKIRQIRHFENIRDAMINGN